jgi:hypothetical protein
MFGWFRKLEPKFFLKKKKKKKSLIKSEYNLNSKKQYFSNTFHPTHALNV